MIVSLLCIQVAVLGDMDGNWVAPLRPVAAMRSMTSLTEVCHNVATEPPLQPLSGETLVARSANTNDGARLDICARGFWNASQDAFFDVRVFYPNASSNRSAMTSSAYRKHEQAKKREYGQLVREIEHGVFTPLVLSSTGGMGREATTFYKRLADLISQKCQMVMGWLRCRLSFASLRTSIMCIRGSRSSLGRPVAIWDKYHPCTPLCD